MAQKTEKEETEFKVHEALALCINNCGVTGNPATNNMCQKCFNATTATSSSSTTATSGTTTALTTMSTSPGVTGGAILKFSARKTARSSLSRSPDRSDLFSPTTLTRSLGQRDIVESVTQRKVVNRCSGCRRKVGLTGFRCRCGELFCSDHRYSDRHDCSYDYKAAGREAIERENPVVKAAKIVRV